MCVCVCLCVKLMWWYQLWTDTVSSRTVQNSTEEYVFLLRQYVDYPVISGRKSLDYRRCRLLWNVSIFMWRSRWHCRRRISITLTLGFYPVQPSWISFVLLISTLFLLSSFLGSPEHSYNFIFCFSLSRRLISILSTCTGCIYNTGTNLKNEFFPSKQRK